MLTNGYCSPSPTLGLTECKKCPVGKIADSSRRTCVQCEPGKFADKQGSSTCTVCEAGMTCWGLRVVGVWLYFLIVFFFLILHLKGTFTDESGATKCKKCQPGTFQAYDGETMCDRYYTSNLNHHTEHAYHTSPSAPTNPTNPSF